MSASKDYFKKAGQAAKKQNFDYAIELYMQGLMIDPKSTEQRRKMHKVMTLAIEEKGGNPQGGMAVKIKVMPILANVKKLMLQKKWDEAQAELDAVEHRLATEPDVVRVRYLLERGRVFRSSGDPDRARPLFEEAWELARARSPTT